MNEPTKNFISTEQEIANRRNAVFYGFLFIASAAIVSLFLKVKTNSDVNANSISYAIAILFFLLGILFIKVIQIKLHFLDSENSNNSIWYSLTISVLLFLTILTIQVLKKNDSVVAPLFYTSVFILPFTVMQCWLSFKHLLAPHFYKIYYLPKTDKTNQSVTVFLNSIFIKIRLSPTIGLPEINYETTVPNRLTVGEMFNYFVNDTEHNNLEPEHSMNIKNAGDGWLFYTASFAGLSLRQLDADSSLIKNGVKNNSVVVAKRIQKSLAENNQL